MDIADLKEKLVAVVGYGQEGQATIEYLLKHGVRPVLFDNRPWDSFTEIEQRLLRGGKINLVLGKDYLTELKGFDVVFRSPGVWRLRPELLVQEQSGTIITSQTKWFFEHCPAPIIGVTGTKGKGTTATLIKNIYSAARGEKSPVYLTGNIGEVQPFSFLDSLKPSDMVVYELSSFQLQDLDRSPHIAVVLMITEDHLDVHASIEEYHQAKQNIVRHQEQTDFAILNQDYPASKKLSGFTPARQYFFSRRQPVNSGCFWENEELIVYNVSAPDTIDREVLLKASELKLRGKHNWENVAAAALAAVCGGIPFETIRQEACSFTGLEHRLELIGIVKDITFYNDSFSTTPDTAIAAINSFTEPLIVILGGSEKGSDFMALGKAISESSNIKALILIGKTAPRIKQAIKAAGFSGIITEGAKDMTEISQQIAAVAGKGDVVLFSPASASFDMFANYKERGKQFKQAVRNLQSNA